MKLPPLYSRRSDGKVQIWEKEVLGNEHRSHSGIVGGLIVTSQWTVCAGKNTGRANATSPEQQALAEAKSEWKKKKDKGYSEDVSGIDTQSFFEPMLAKVWQDYKEDILADLAAGKASLWMQPKLDGIRVIGKEDGLWSRLGKQFKSIPHIHEALKPLFDYNPEYIFDGEAYADKYANDFNKICSLAKKSKPTEEDLEASAKSIEYHIYDFPFWDDVFSARFNELKKVLKFSKSKSLKLVKTYKVTTEAEIIEKFESFIEAGYEGAMIRLDTKYENKRTKNLLKYKEFVDDEYLIVDVLEGVGNRTGVAGKIVCQRLDGKPFLDGESTCECSIKGTMVYCKEMLENKDQYIGKIGTVKYFNLTPAGKPRFPYFMRLREDDY